MLYLWPSHHDRFQVGKDPEGGKENRDQLLLFWTKKVLLRLITLFFMGALLVCPCIYQIALDKSLPKIYCYEDASHRISTWEQEKRQISRRKKEADKWMYKLEGSWCIRHPTKASPVRAYKESKTPLFLLIYIETRLYLSTTIKFNLICGQTLTEASMKTTADSIPKPHLNPCSRAASHHCQMDHHRHPSK